jgi:hypothetical protein
LATELATLKPERKLSGASPFIGSWIVAEHWLEEHGDDRRDPEPSHQSASLPGPSQWSARYAAPVVRWLNIANDPRVITSGDLRSKL